MKSEDPFVWILYGHQGTEDGIALGLLVVPSNGVGFLTEDFVLNQLNTEYCFDFNYEPLEGDNIVVVSGEKGGPAGYLSFIYRKENWGAGHHGVNEIVKLKNYGTLQVNL